MKETVTQPLIMLMFYCIDILLLSKFAATFFAFMSNNEPC